MNPARSRLWARLALLAAAGALALVLALPARSAPASTGTTTCRLTSTEKYNRDGRTGPTYTRSLTVSGGATCRTGHALIRSYYRCRLAHGGTKGRCTSRVLGYSCAEKRANVIPTQFDATATCRKSRARVRTEYTQLT